ncbi:MAG: iron-sulfur cluster assembly scaffold protein [Thermoplasmatota archaeon]
MEYTDIVMDHFKNPRNVGTLKDASGVGMVGNPVCGDMMEISLIVKDDVIMDIKFRTYGCASAIATTSMLTEMAKGKTLEEAEKLTWDDVVMELEGLPPIKVHCSLLAIQGLKKALYNYYKSIGVDRPDLHVGDEEEDDHDHGAECETDHDPVV